MCGEDVLFRRNKQPFFFRLLSHRDGANGSCSGIGAGVVAGTVGVTAAVPAWTPDDPEYYNDLPGKVPPDFGPPPVPPLPNYHAPSGPGDAKAVHTASANACSSNAAGSASTAGSGGAAATGATAATAAAAAAAAGTATAAAAAAMPASPSGASSSSAGIGSVAAAAATVAGGSKKAMERTSARHGLAAVDLTDNLIDLNSDLPLVARTEAGATGSPFPDHEYVNSIMGSSSDFKGPSSVKDPFDMRMWPLCFVFRRFRRGRPSMRVCLFFLPTDPFSGALPSPLPSALLPPFSTASGGTHAGSCLMAGSSVPAGGRAPMTTGSLRGPLRATKTKVTAHEAQLTLEIWFHGPISRKEAEDLLKHVSLNSAPAFDPRVLIELFWAAQDGDFLVRESQGSHGQYVLTGMQSGHHKHLLLVDPEGVVSISTLLQLLLWNDSSQ